MEGDTLKQHCTFFQMCAGENDTLVFSPIYKRKVPMCSKCAEHYEKETVCPSTSATSARAPAPPAPAAKPSLQWD